mmetsp:Transcript_19354/g.23118  ORF Transcript_19354/g.23118 Transcript_19354/m.23118 type:complete len:306 (-) Transcript_19354:240-1157(-)|eukprot:CAMPEP_0197846906 /NCGR_PEP_ID=MMETSP1438-20131217/4709_1 /TAXON_ID=1461541 /ORGANISM="Pterosperma sp., Strain CCMP1384" /LENGTH=305 /DNA_ID=CAMNT_0043458691 /DNA_START=45 /DNA_END=962 /DNA_ORIENTATION=-
MTKSNSTSSRVVMSAAALCFSALLIASNFAIYGASIYVKDLAVVEGALVDTATMKPVSSVRHEAVIHDPLSLEGLSQTKFIITVDDDGLPNLRETIVSYKRIPVSSAIPKVTIAHMDGFYHLFMTPNAYYSAFVNHNGELVFSPVDENIFDELESTHRKLLITSGRDAQQQALGTEYFNGEPALEAAVDHLYGVHEPNCPAGTSQVDKEGNSLPDICGAFNGTFPDAGCLGVVSGFYDVQANGRCLDYCFYATPTGSCGDGYWTCALAGEMDPVPDAAGTHLPMNFCATHSTCLHPKCENEGDVV